MPSFVSNTFLNVLGDNHFAKNELSAFNFALQNETQHKLMNPELCMWKCFVYSCNIVMQYLAIL